MRSFPHHRNMGWRDDSMVLTVMRSASGHSAMGPTGVVLQSKARVRSAISPVPKISLARAGTVTTAPLMSRLIVDCGSFYASFSWIVLQPEDLSPHPRMHERCEEE